MINHKNTYKGNTKKCAKNVLYNILKGVKKY